jgi:hypothetical protein
MAMVYYNVEIFRRGLERVYAEDHGTTTLVGTGSVSTSTVSAETPFHSHGCRMTFFVNM